MSNKVALHFICKNEAHVVNRMLGTSIGFADLIVAVDTGSTDNTIEVIKKFGSDNNIPTFVFERPFDNFENSRNCSMDKLREVVSSEMKWDPKKVWGYFYDCDEELIVDKNFKKDSLDKDLYMINAYLGQMNYTRNTFFRVSGPFKWYGPVHEFIIPTQQNTTAGMLNEVKVKVNMDGGSWIEGNTHKKYRKHAEMLEDYINHKDRDPRWVFYTAQSYHDSASVPNNKEENDERMRRSMKYYKERVNHIQGYHEERFYSQYRVGVISKILDKPWIECQAELLKAYSMDPLRAEPFKIIIDHYQQLADWNMSYLYSKFAVDTYSGKSPFPTRLLFIDDSLYSWKLLELHSTSCFYTNRLDEAKDCFDRIMKIMKTDPTRFSDQDKQRLEINSRHFSKKPELAKA